MTGGGRCADPAGPDGMAPRHPGYVAAMAEFERERALPATAEDAFAVAADLDALDRWLPHGVSVTHDDGRAVSAHVEAASREVDAAGLARARPEQRRLEWGSRDTPDYAGWLQVEHAGEGRSSAVLHLSFLGDQPENHGGRAAREVEAAMDEALDKLARVVEESAAGS